MDGWLDAHCGYLVGNQGPGKVDFRFFAQGNLLSILFDLATAEESKKIMNLYELHWEALIGEMPAKIVYPTVSGMEWMSMTGSDPKNAAWSYHNGGNWPVLRWPFVGAALTAGRRDLAQRAMDLLSERIEGRSWPEYYDGRSFSRLAGCSMSGSQPTSRTYASVARGFRSWAKLPSSCCSFPMQPESVFAVFGKLLVCPSGFSASVWC
jgi:hypothetical protein